MASFDSNRCLTPGRPSRRPAGGANAIARERADRSAEFLAYLPISRVRILASKAALPLAVVSVVWAAALAAHLVAYAIDGGTGPG